jgi:hypothetical protein
MSSASATLQKLADSPCFSCLVRNWTAKYITFSASRSSNVESEKVSNRSTRRAKSDFVRKIGTHFHSLNAGDVAFRSSLAQMD